MSEPAISSLKVRDWDSATKLAGIIALLVGGLWSVWMYIQTTKQRNLAAEIDAQKPFSSKRLEVYEKVSTLTAAVAQSDLSAQVRREKRQELDQVVNGPLALVAQNKVFLALVDFYACADDRNCRKGSLALYSRNVARACRTSIEESWRISLPPVPASESLP
jgi:hypothetical protein